MWCVFQLHWLWALLASCVPALHAQAPAVRAQANSFASSVSAKALTVRGCLCLSSCSLS